MKVAVSVKIIGNEFARLSIGDGWHDYSNGTIEDAAVGNHDVRT